MPTGEEWTNNNNNSSSTHRARKKRNEFTFTHKQSAHVVRFYLLIFDFVGFFVFHALRISQFSHSLMDDQNKTLSQVQQTAHTLLLMVRCNQNMCSKCITVLHTFFYHSTVGIQIVQKFFLFLLLEMKRQGTRERESERNSKNNKTLKIGDLINQ